MGYSKYLEIIKKNVSRVAFKVYKNRVANFFFNKINDVLLCKLRVQSKELLDFVV